MTICKGEIICDGCIIEKKRHQLMIEHDNDNYHICVDCVMRKIKSQREQDPETRRMEQISRDYWERSIRGI